MDQEELTKKTVGDFVADIVVEGSIILELKSVKRIIRAHEVQLVNYVGCNRNRSWIDPEFCRRES